MKQKIKAILSIINSEKFFLATLEKDSFHIRYKGFYSATEGIKFASDIHDVHKLKNDANIFCEDIKNQLRTCKN